VKGFLRLSRFHGVLLERRGYSLIEVLLALALVSLALVVATSGLRRPSQNAELQSYVTELSVRLRKLRQQAITSQHPQEFRFDANARIYSFKPGGPAWKVPETLDVAMYGADLGSAQENISRLIFFFDGSCTGGTLEVSDGKATRRIVVQWLTGAISVEG
jgi:general secretion pathway protein H